MSRQAQNEDNNAGIAARKVKARAGDAYFSMTDFKCTSYIFSNCDNLKEGRDASLVATPSFPTLQHNRNSQGRIAMVVAVAEVRKGRAAAPLTLHWLFPET